MLAFGKVAGALAGQIGVAPGKRDRFQARLKQLQRMGFPEGVNVGRYAKASYSADHVFQLAVCLELIQTGMSPERGIKTVRHWWDSIRRAILLARDSGDFVFIVFQPKDFGGLTSNLTDSDDDRIAWISNQSITFKLRDLSDPDLVPALQHVLSAPRSIILNIGHVVTELERSFAEEDVDLDQFWSEADEWRSQKDWAGRLLGK